MSDFGLARSEIESAIQCTTDEHLLHHLQGALVGVTSLEEQLEASRLALDEISRMGDSIGMAMRAREALAATSSPARES